VCESEREDGDFTMVQVTLKRIYIEEETMGAENLRINLIINHIEKNKIKCNQYSN